MLHGVHHWDEARNLLKQFYEFREKKPQVFVACIGKYGSKAVYGLQLSLLVLAQYLSFLSSIPDFEDYKYCFYAKRFSLPKESKHF